MASVRTTTSQSNRKIDRDHAEFLLNADETVGSYANGDVDVHPAERWPDWTDDFYYQPTKEEQAWAAQEFGQEDDDLDALVNLVMSREDFEDLSEWITNLDPRNFTPEVEWEGDRAEFERWLDSIAPTDAELDARCDREDSWSLGHQP